MLLEQGVDLFDDLLTQLTMLVFPVAIELMDDSETAADIRLSQFGECHYQISTGEVWLNTALWSLLLRILITFSAVAQ